MEMKYEGPERRQNTRLYHPVPVEYNFINDIQSRELSMKRSGYVCNISAGGALLELDELNEDWIEDMKVSKIKIAIKMHIDAYPEPISAIARVAWIKEKKEGKKKYQLGLSYADITDEDRDRVKKYVINSYLQTWERLKENLDPEE